MRPYLSAPVRRPILPIPDSTSFRDYIEEGMDHCWADTAAASYAGLRNAGGSQTPPSCFNRFTFHDVVVALLRLPG